MQSPWFLGQDEGQHFDRKSLFEGPPDRKRQRDRRSVRDQVASYVAAFANAEGGVLILGIEDDGALSGHAYPQEAIDALLSTPRSRLQPPQAEGFLVKCRDIELIVFDVPAADGPVQVVGDGFPLRVGDRTVQASESQIRSLKFQGLAESWESFPSPLMPADLDPALIARARRGAGLEAWGDEDYLLKRKLADRRGRGLSLRRAAELLFARSGPDHPNAGVRIFRVIGAERRLGAEHNVEERPRIEGPLPAVIEAAMREIEGLLRRPSRLVGTRFRPTPEYPDFSWKEALLNALAHRDYRVEGRTTEVWLYEDRMEVVSPGPLLPEIRLEDLIARRRIHQSRNPRLVRALVDLGFMRDQGEGIPRMFAEMEGLFLPEPTIEADHRSFSVVLRNTPTLSAADRDFIASLGGEEISDQEFRALLEAHHHGQIDNARLRAVSGLDTLGASRLLGRLRDRGLLQLHPAGSASFYTLSDREQLPSDRVNLTPDREHLTPDREYLSSDREQLPPHIQQAISALGARPRKEPLRAMIAALCSLRPMTPAELSKILGFQRPYLLVNRHLKPMCDAGLLARTHPDIPNHPEQSYQTTHPASE